MKIYGPYKRKDGREVIIKVDGAVKTTQSYPRYLMELHLGRALLPTEEVDHVDNNPTNNSIGNLQILSSRENRVKEITRPHRRRKVYEGVCSICGDTFERPLNYVEGSNKKGKAGPFCSRRCAGIFSTRKPVCTQ